MHNDLRARAQPTAYGESGLVVRLRLVIALLGPWQRVKFVCLVTERVALGVCDLLLAAAMYLLFEELQGRNSYRANSWLPHTALATTYWTIGIVVLRLLLDLSVSRSATQFTQGIYAELLMRLTRGYGELRWNQFVQQNRSELVKHCMTTALDAAYAYQIYLELISGLIVVVIMSAALVYKSPAVSAGLLCLVALLFVLHRFVLRRRLQEAANNRERVVRTLQRILTDMFSAAKEIRAYNNQEFFHKKLRAEVVDLGENNVKLALLPQVSRVLAEQGVVLLFLCIVLVVLLKGGDVRQVLSLLLFYFVISRRMLPILSQLALLNSQLEGAHENLQITHRELEECALRREDVLPEREPEPGFALQLRDVRYGFGETTYILKDISLDVREGEIVLLRGVSGSGKSSLINLVAGVAQPSEGVLRVHRMAVAYVPQDIAMLDDSIRNNMLFGLPHMDDEALYSALSVANLEAFVRELPETLQTRVGDSGVLLSGGQRQRLGIARAVLRNARLLLLDEATSALDEQNEAEILARLAASGHTVVLVTHRRHRGHQASRVLHLQNGVLSEAMGDNAVDESKVTRS